MTEDQINKLLEEKGTQLLALMNVDMSDGDDFIISGDDENNKETLGSDDLEVMGDDENDQETLGSDDLEVVGDVSNLASPQHKTPDGQPSDQEEPPNGANDDLQQEDIANQIDELHEQASDIISAFTACVAEAPKADNLWDVCTGVSEEIANLTTVLNRLEVLATDDKTAKQAEIFSNISELIASLGLERENMIQAQQVYLEQLNPAQQPGGGPGGESDPEDYNDEGIQDSGPLVVAQDLLALIQNRDDIMQNRELSKLDLDTLQDCHAKFIALGVETKSLLNQMISLASDNPSDEMDALLTAARQERRQIRDELSLLRAEKQVKAQQNADLQTPQGGDNDILAGLGKDEFIVQ
jgi:hypothetical protein